METVPTQFARILATIAFVGVVASCGPAKPTGTPDAGPQADPAYWGLADAACYRFADGSANQYVIFMSIDQGVTFGGVTTYQLHHLQNGMAQGTDWVAPTGTSLALYQHYTPQSFNGTIIPDTNIVYTPPPDELVEGLMVNGSPHVTTTSAASSTSGVTTTGMLQFTVNVEEVDNITADQMTMPLAAAQYLITIADPAGTMSTTNRVWFVPHIGIVQLGKPGGAAPWVLSRIDQNVASKDCY